MKANFRTLVTAALVGSLSSACGKSMRPLDLNSAGGQSLCTTFCGSDSISQKWSDLDLNGKISGGPYYKQTRTIETDPVRKTVSLKIPLPSNPFGSELSGTIQQIPGSTIFVKQDSSGQWVLGVELPLSSLLKGVDLGEPATLPNGDALPGVPEGELPRLGLKITQANYEFYLYLGVGAAAIYVPIPKYSSPIALELPIRSENQRKVLGYFSLVQAKNSFPGGAYLSFVIPDEIARAIDDLI